MRILLSCVAAFVLLSAEVVVAAPQLAQVNRFCSAAAIVAGSLSDGSSGSSDVPEMAAVISDNAAYDYNKTASKLRELATKHYKDVAAADVAALEYYWCLVDETNAEPGDLDLVVIQRKAAMRYQTILSEE